MRDFDIRVHLKNHQLAKYINDGVSRIVEEMKLPAAYARIDLAVINGHLHGFEIKSASDTLQRLSGQIEAYTKVFDFLYVITEEKHCEKVIKSIPEWVGVYVCIGSPEKAAMKRVRASKKNNNKEGFYIAKLLWREELISILAEQNIHYRKKDRNWILCEIISNSIEVNRLSELVRAKLKARPLSWLNDATTSYEET